MPELASFSVLSLGGKSALVVIMNKIVLSSILVKF
jgi:hypothetical protein